MSYEPTTANTLDGLVGRYYDPGTGQFLNVDPLVDETGQPYAYTGDDPVNGVDPLGLGCGIFATLCHQVGQVLNAGKSFVEGLAGTPRYCGANGAAYDVGNVAWWTAAIGAIVGVGVNSSPNADNAVGAEAEDDLSTIVGPDGVELPGVPAGEAGIDLPNGVQYSIPQGTPGLDPRVVSVRVMDPVTTGKYQYPNGYVVYMNSAGQTVNPLTGRTVSNVDPFAHIPLP